MSQSPLPQPMYLTSAEVRALRKPRLCVFLNCIPGDNRPDSFVASVQPPIDGAEVRSSLPGPIEKVLLAQRHVGFPIAEPKEWPVHVYVVRALDGTVYTEEFLNAERLEIIAWGELFPTLAAAEEYSGTWWERPSV